MWVMKDYEDNLYISQHYGYHGCSIPDEGRYWFSRGGFSQQPNLLCGPVPYLHRGEIAHFVRAFFNPFAAAFHADTRMMTEHPAPELGDWMGDHYKTSDESQSTHWLRLMFACERDDELLLGWGIPRYWLRDGSEIALHEGRTRLGTVSLRIVSELSRDRVVAEVELPERLPRGGVSLRLRTPGDRSFAPSS